MSVTPVSGPGELSVLPDRNDHRVRGCAVGEQPDGRRPSDQSYQCASQWAATRSVDPFEVIKGFEAGNEVIDLFYDGKTGLYSEVKDEDNG